MIYLFTGDDNSIKNKKINEIKEEVLKTSEAVNFDYELLYSDKLHGDDLKKALLALPVVSKKRVVVLKTIQKLSPKNKEIVLKFFDSEQDHLIFILDTDQSDLNNSFIKKIKNKARVFNVSPGPSENVFAMTNAMTARNPVEALKILSRLLSGGDHPLQIMGALVWFWGRMKNRLSQANFKKGLEVLKEADLNIKRSRLRPDYTLEKLVVSLSVLIA